MVNFVLEMMEFVFKMMDVVSKDHKTGILHDIDFASSGAGVITDYSEEESGLFSRK